MAESECLKDDSNSLRNFTFCCVCCFRRRNETNSLQRRGKKKRKQGNEDEDNTGVMPLDKSGKEEHQRKEQDHWSIVSLGEHDHGDAITLAAKPHSIETEDNSSDVHLNVHHNEEKHEQNHLVAVSRKAHCEEQQRKDRQDHSNSLSWGVWYERERQRGQDHVSDLSEGASTNEEQDYQNVPNKEKQQLMGTEHLNILSLRVTYEKEKQEEQSHVSCQYQSVAHKKQDYQGMPYKQEQRLMGPEHSNNLSPDVTSEKEKQDDHVSTVSEGMPSKEEQDCQDVPHKKEQWPVGLEYLNSLSLSVTFEQENKEGNHVSTVSEGAPSKEEHDGQDVPPYKEQQQPVGLEHLHTWFLGVPFEQENKEGDHVSIVSEGAPSKEEHDGQDVPPYKEQQQPVGLEHLHTWFLGIPFEQENKKGDHLSIVSEGAPSKEEHDGQDVPPYKEQQQPVGLEHLHTWFLGVPFEQENKEGDHLSIVSEGAPSKEEQDGQDVPPYKEEQWPVGPEYLNNLFLGVTFEQDKEEDYVSSQSKGATSKEEQDCQGVSYKKEQQHVGVEYVSTLSLGVTYDQEKQEQDHMSSESASAVYTEEQDCQGIPYKKEQPHVEFEHVSTLSLGVTHEQEKQGQDYVSSESESAVYTEEQDYQGVPYKEEQQHMGFEQVSTLSLGATYEHEQENQGQDHMSSESEGAAYKEEQDCQAIPSKDQQSVGPECLSTWFLGVTHEKELQVGKDHVSSVSEDASCREYYQGAPYSEQQQVKGPGLLSTLSLPGISEEEQQVRQDHLRTRSLGALYEMDKQVAQNHRSNLFLFVTYDEGKQQDGQNPQKTLPLSVSCNSERELREGQDPQKIMSPYMPREEEQEKQDLLNTRILCMSCEKGKQQEDQNLLHTLYEKEMKQQDGQQNHLSPLSLCEACEENEKEEEEQDRLSTTLLYEP